MPRKLRIPKYRLNKTTGRALVELGGVTHWLGPHGTPESREKYDRLVAEWLASGRVSTAHAAAHADLTVAELVDRFWTHVETFYRKPDGSPTSEVDAYRSALRPLVELYGSTPAAGFGPKALCAVRRRMIDLGWCRTNINKQVARLRTLFKWAVAQELIPAAVHAALMAVSGLRRGKSEAEESDPVRPVPEADVEAVIPHVSKQVAAMIRLQEYTGMRPGEVCLMRWCDIDKSGGGGVWEYTPQEHKTQHLGHARTIYLGPKAQALLAEWGRPDLAGYIFQPREAEAERRAKAHAARTTPPSYGNRPGTNRVRRPRTQPGDRYDVAAYRRAIQRGCEAAFGFPAELKETRGKFDPDAVPETAEGRKARRARAAEWRRRHSWHPHQLRHNAATYLRREYGIDAAKVILGHKTLAATQVYAEQDVAKARQIMGEAG